MQSKLSNFKRGPSQKIGATSPITTEQGGTLSSYTNRIPGTPQCCQSEWGHVGTKGCGSLWEKWKHGTYRLTTFFQNCQCFELFPLHGCQQMWLECLNFWPSDTSSAASCSPDPCSPSSLPQIGRSGHPSWLIPLQGSNWNAAVSSSTDSPQVKPSSLVRVLAAAQLLRVNCVRQALCRSQHPKTGTVCSSMQNN